MIGARARKRNYVVPVLVGGELGGGGFVSGHLGYGGVYDASTWSPHESMDVVLPVIRVVEAEVGRPCHRLVLPPPLRETNVSQQRDEIGAPGTARSTALKSLHRRSDDRRATYSSSVRTQLRRLDEIATLEVGLMSVEDFGEVGACIHQTQSRVGARYRTPPELIEEFLGVDLARCFAVGVRIDGQLVSVGLFLVEGQVGAYFANGWVRLRGPSSPNVAMLDFAFGILSFRGVTLVDLGYSHTEKIRVSKRAYGVREVEYRSYSGFDLR